MVRGKREGGREGGEAPRRRGRGRGRGRERKSRGLFDMCPPGVVSPESPGSEGGGCARPRTAGRSRKEISKPGRVGRLGWMDGWSGEREREREADGKEGGGEGESSFLLAPPVSVGRRLTRPAADPPLTPLGRGRRRLRRLRRGEARRDETRRGEEHEACSARKAKPAGGGGGGKSRRGTSLVRAQRGAGSTAPSLLDLIFVFKLDKSLLKTSILLCFFFFILAYFYIRFRRSVFPLLHLKKVC